MRIGNAAEIIEAITKLIGALAWPAVVIFALIRFGPLLRSFLASISEFRVRGAGLEASARRRLNFDETSQRLYDFWKPEGRIDRSNAAKIAACMRQLGISGSVAWLINAGTPEDRARVAACLSLEP